MDMKPKCKECKHWEFTRTLGSPDHSEWHCRFGFRPNKFCLELAEDNVRCIRDYYRKHPEEQQLKFKF